MENEKETLQEDAAKKSKKTKKAKNPKRRKRALITLAIIAGVIILAFSVCSLVGVIGTENNRKMARSFASIKSDATLVPVQDENGYWTFTTDDDFKIMQLTDVHIGAGFLSLKKDAWALNACASMIMYEKPDLVVVTGDIAYPVPFQAGTFDNLRALKLFADLMENLEVYWTLAFGNHDTEIYSFYSRTKIAEYFEKTDYNYCLFERGPAQVDGEGNQVINVKNSKGLITQSLIILDSHSYVGNDYFGIKWQYDNIHPNQVEWYEQVVTALSTQNNAVLSTLAPADVPADTSAFTTVRSLLFFHIPLTEYADAWSDYAAADYNDTDDTIYVYGIAGETGEKLIYSGVGQDDLFEKALELNSTKGIFCGHDHLNNFSIKYKGIRLTYGMSIDYLAYSKIYQQGAQRGCTIIETSPDGSFTCRPENYYQDKYSSDYAKETVQMS